MVAARGPLAALKMQYEFDPNTCSFRWLIVTEKHCWMAADSADKSKQTGYNIAT
jgi:hypothetical protein